MTENHLILLLFMLAVYGSPILLIVIQVRRNRRVGRPGLVKAADLAGLRSKQGTYRGRYFDASRGYGSKDSGPPSLRLPSVHPVHPLKVTHRYGFDRFAARIGFSSIIPSGDEAFDQSVLVETDRPNHVHVTVASWHAADATERVELSRDEFEGLHAGVSRLELEVMKGALGHERVTAASILEH